MTSDMSKELSAERLKNRLEKIGVSKDIIEHSIAIHNKLPEAFHEWKDNKKFYLCVSEAYRSTVSVPETHIDIEKEFVFTANGLKELHKLCYHLGYSPVLAIYEPIHYVPKYMKIVGISADYDSHLSRITTILNKYLVYSDKANEMLPQDVAAAVVLYYAKNNGFSVSIDDYKSHWQSMKVPSLVDTISECDNSC